MHRLREEGLAWNHAHRVENQGGAHTARRHVTVDHASAKRREIDVLHGASRNSRAFIIGARGMRELTAINVSGA
jgi:hypothetical protein